MDSVSACFLYDKPIITAIAAVAYLNYFIFFVPYRYLIQLCRRKGVMDVAFMDPLMINEYCIQRWEVATLDHIVNFLDVHHDKPTIHLVYNFG